MIIFMVHSRGCALTQTQWFKWDSHRAVTHILVVELEKAEPTSTSRSSRTTRSESLALLRSSDSFLSAFSRILKLNSTSQKWRAFPETSARLVPSPFRRSGPTFHFWARCLTSLIRMVYYFHTLLLRQGILVQLHGRMVVRSHLFLHRCYEQQSSFSYLCKICRLIRR